MTDARGKGQRLLNWRDAGFVPRSDEGPLVAVYPLGQGPSAPVVTVVRYAPEAKIPVHFHDADYCTIVVEGDLQVGRHWEHVGSMRLVTAGTAYGPLVAGSNGCTVIDVFGVGAALVPNAVRDEDRFLFEGPGVRAYVTDLLAKLDNRDVSSPGAGHQEPTR